LPIASELKIGVTQLEKLQKLK